MRQRGTDFFMIFEKAAIILEDSASELSKMLEGDFKDFSKSTEKIHTLKSKANTLYHSFIKQLEDSFITPIDREDLITIFIQIERTIKKINKTAVLINISQVTDIRPGAKEIAKLIIKGSKALEESIKKLRNFKKSKEFHKHILKLSHIIEEANLIYNSSVKQLFIEERNALMAIKWTGVYDLLIESLEAMENTAKTMEAVVIKNL